MVQYMDNNSGFAQWNANKNAKAEKSSIGGFMRWFLIFIAVWWMLGILLAPKAPTTVVESAPVIDLSAVPTTVIENDDIAVTVQGLRISNIALNDFNVSATNDAHVTLLGSDGAYADSAEYGAIYDDRISISNIRADFEKTWNIASNLDETVILNSIAGGAA